MDTRLKILALACAAPLALAACEGAEEEQQVGQAEEPAGQPPAATDDTAPPPAATEESAGMTEESEETQAAQMPEDSAEEPTAGEPAEEDIAQAPEESAEEPAAGEPAEEDIAQAPQQETGAAPSGEAPVDFIGNWAMQGEACPGDWEFAEQQIESPEGSFQVQDVQDSGEDVELEVTSMEGEQTQTLALSFPEGQQDTMVVRNGGDEVTLERCQ